MTTEVEQGREKQELEPCPFCGSPTVQVRDLDDGVWFFCYRKDCSVEILSDYETLEGAIRHWNTRAPVAALAAERDRLLREVKFAVANGHKWTLEDWANWIKNHARAALEEHQ
jgi:restriction alleviation protein Lar